MRAFPVVLVAVPLVATALSGCLSINLDDLLGKKTTSAGCQSDLDCEGSDACEKGKCVSQDGSEGGGPGEGEGAQGGEGEGEGDVVDPRGPQFLQFSTNITTMGPTDTLIFTVVVTHPDGIQNVVGGSLVDPGTGASYGAFTTLSTTGSYELSLSWEALNEVQPIDFSFSTARTFQARFFDQAGHVSEQSLGITLSCGGSSPACDGSCGFARCGDGQCTSSNGAPDQNGDGMCNNVCESLVTSSNCGSCGHSCSTSCGVNEFGGFDCACNSGFDCPFGDACLDSQCASVSLETPSSPTNFTPQASFQGSLFDLCLDGTSASLVCQQLGFSSGTVLSGGFSTFGATASCFGASSLEGCTWTSQSSCLVSQVDCGGGGGGDFSCAIDGSVTDNQTLSASISSRFNTRSATCSSSTGGAEGLFTFTAPATHNYEFVGFGGDSGDPLVLSVLSDCSGSTLACAVDSQFNEPISNVALSAGQTVLVVVDTSFTPSGAVGVEVLDN